MTESSRPLKKFSQNFLTNPQIQEKIVNALQIGSNDAVMEVGPGKGALSVHISTKGPKHFWGIEIDRRWAQLLEEQMGGKIEVVQEDFLNIDLQDFQARANARLKVIGNLPYNITSPILFQLIDQYQHVDSAVLMVQKEVAKRIVAGPGSKEYGILSVVCQTYAQAEYLFDVKPGNFFPKPTVTSGVFKLLFNQTVGDIKDESLFRNIVRQTFNTRRKMLRTSLVRNFDKSIVYSLESVDLNNRPEQLSVQDFIRLANEVHSYLKQTRSI